MIIGIDTSCYTTSIAVIDQEKNLLVEKRRILDVAKGSRGLAQSAALFQHIREGRAVFQAALAELGQHKQSVQGVCVSSCPRPQKDAYMPVFLAGVFAAELLAGAYQTPLYHTSHQEGHLMAGIQTAHMPNCQQFLAVHLSGGTSELLLVRQKPTGFAVTLLGGSKDLHAGQLVDRVGVALGLPFPCGPALDQMAMEGAARQDGGNKIRFRSYCQGYTFSFSGLEMQALQRIKAAQQQGELSIQQYLIAQGVFQGIANTLEKLLREAVQQHQIYDVLLVGGVAGSNYLRQRLHHRLDGCCQLYFAEPYYSKDNAYGVALLGLQQHLAAKRAGKKKQSEN